MSQTVPTTHQTTVSLPSGREIRVVVRFGPPDPADEAIPYGADAVLRIVDEDLDDAVSLAEAIQDLLFLGETEQRRSAASAARLAATVADVEAARAAERDL